MKVPFFSLKALVGIVLILLVGGCNASTKATVTERSAATESDAYDSELDVTPEAGGVVGSADGTVAIEAGGFSAVAKVKVSRPESAPESVENLSRMGMLQLETTADGKAVPSSALLKDMTIAVKLQQDAAVRNLQVVVIGTGEQDGEILATLSGDDISVSQLADGRYVVTFKTREPNAIFVVIDEEEPFVAADNEPDPTDTPSDSSPSPSPASGSQVTALYPKNGKDWNAYVKNDGADWLSATDVACVGTETRYDGCLHGGVMRTMSISGVSDCSGWSAADALSAFRWVCDDSKDDIRIVSAGLMPGKSLADLLSGAGWRKNKVTATNGNKTVVSAEAIWWTNPIATLPDNSDGADSLISLADAGKVYVLNTSRASQGYNINADRISVVITPGATLSYAGSSADNINAQGETDTPAYSSLLSGGDQKFLWVEGQFSGSAASGSDAEQPWYFSGIAHSRFGPVKLVAEAGYQEKPRIVDSNHNLFYDIALANHYGILVENSDYNTFTRMRMMQCKFMCLTLSQSDHNTIVDYLAASAVYQGLWISESQYNTVSGVTVAHNAFGGLDLYKASNNTIHQALVVNNKRAGVKVRTTAASNSFSQLASGYNEHHGIDLSSADCLNNQVAGVLMLTGNGSGTCWSAAASTGLVNGTCTTTGTDGSSTYSGGVTSTATLITKDASNTNLDWTGSFVGKVTTDDAVNASDTNGAQAIASIDDWLHFSNSYRIWGIDGSAFPNTDHVGNCASGNCRIWDWRTDGSDTKLKNRSGDGKNANEAFVKGSACPSQVNGDKTTTDTQGNTYLLNAYEIVDDYIGDNDGLCESSERCIYTPNFGAYQGSGSYEGNACVFDANGGSVTGVEMLGFPTN